MEVNFPGGSANLPNFRPLVVPLVALLLGVSVITTSFYQVDPDEMGVVQRFGRYDRTTSPGLHMMLPLGIETVQKIKVTHVFKFEFGFRTVQAGIRSVYEGREGFPQKSMWGKEGNPFLDESLMLTGDLNTAVVEWIVQFRVKDPVLYAFHIRNIGETIRNMSEAIMRLVVGDHTLNEVLTSGREEIRKRVERELQEVLDSYGAGVEILNVVLQDVNPPDEVKSSFNEVNEARQEKEKSINQAWENYNRVVPKAKGEAEKAIREAEGYALDRVNRAQGDAEKFSLVWEAYKLAPDVTRRRLYLETLKEVLPSFKEKILMDESVKGILPFLNLSEKKEAAQTS